MAQRPNPQLARTFATIAKVLFLLATVCFVLAGAEAKHPQHPVEWGLALLAAGLLFS